MFYLNVTTEKNVYPPEKQLDSQKTNNTLQTVSLPGDTLFLGLELLASSRCFSLWQTYIWMFAHIHILKEAIEFEMTTQYQCLKQESINCCCYFPFRCIPQCLCSDAGQEDPNASLVYGELRADLAYCCQSKMCQQQQTVINSLVQELIFAPSAPGSSLTT